jgi:hypothetical protein
MEKASSIEQGRVAGSAVVGAKRLGLLAELHRPETGCKKTGARKFPSEHLELLKMSGKPFVVSVEESD